MKLFQKIKTKKTTLDDCIKHYRENPQYRYVVVAGKEQTPVSIHKTLESAREDLCGYWNAGGKHPVGVVDLAFYEMENTYASKTP